VNPPDDAAWDVELPSGADAATGEAPQAFVPDAIEPVTAYRAWRYVPQDMRASLHPMARRPGEAWLPDAWTEARCLAGGLSAYVIRSHDLGHHQAPREGCTCGLYAMKNLDDLVAELLMLGLPAMSSAGIVVGKVELAGRVIEHELGYRAQYGRVVELLSAPGVLEAPFAAAASYGVPVSNELADSIERSGRGLRPNRRPGRGGSGARWSRRLGWTSLRRGPFALSMIALMFLVGAPLLAHSLSPSLGIVSILFYGGWLMPWSGSLGNRRRPLSVGPPIAAPDPRSAPRLPRPGP
jgi:hypothetical protein